MDEDTKKILTEWGFSEYIDVFKENKIDVYTLNILDQDYIKELIKPIGDRARFSQNLNIWKQISLDDVSTHSLTPLSTPSLLQPSQETECDFVDEDILIERQSNEKIIRLSDATKKETPSNTNTTAVDLVAVSTQQEIECDFVDILSSKHRNTPLSEVTNKETLSPETSAYYILTQQRQPLRDLLTKSAEGRLLLKLHENEGLLTNNSRRKICNIIVQHLLLQNTNERVSHELLFNFAKEIKEIFPKENMSTYYVPYVNNNKMKVKTCAKGKLYDCLQNRKRQYREADKKSHTLQVDQDTDLQNQQEENDNNEDIQQDVMWLKNTTEPWQLVQEKWRKSSPLRLKNLNNGLTIAEYMNEFPALKKPTGYSLIVEDFNRLYPEKEHLLHLKFSSYKKKIIQQAIQKSSRDGPLKTILQQLSRLSEAQNEIKDLEAEAIIAFMVLPLLLGNPLAKVKKGNWRPSKQEACEGFITHVTTAAEVQATISSRRDKFSRLNVTLQPFIIIVGKDFTAIDKYYVVVYDTFYVLHSIVDAVDVCFKIFHALNCRYPIECFCTWQFIQKGLYDLKTCYDKQFISVNSLITDLGINVD